ncbi:DddA-like double-stranded DNA deaminase toxin [Actinokineospora inagensis]|uniref:DddA-like double-stranded DNA deaminase toxin n=1 Tax=Actinokineospora inagensis TaxID=103730 RepID=UPI0009FC8112
MPAPAGCAAIPAYCQTHSLESWCVSIESEASRLRELGGSIAASGSAAVDRFTGWLDETTQAVQTALGHSARSEQIIGLLGAARSHLGDLDAALTQASTAVSAAADHHGQPTAPTDSSTGPPPAGASGDRPSPGTAPPPEPQGEPNTHGDRYPEEAIPYHDFMPPRVRTGQPNSPPMTGWVLLDGKDFGEVTATRRDPWAEQAAQRIRELRVPNADRLGNHVEVKVAVMQVAMQRKDGCVVINNAPCGSQPGSYPPGCHGTLPRILPKGYTLTVLGTDTQGNPFKHTYHGRATR